MKYEHSIVSILVLNSIDQLRADLQMATESMASNGELDPAERSYIYLYSSDRVITSPDITIVSMTVTKVTDTIIGRGLLARADRKEEISVWYNAPEGAIVQVSESLVEYTRDSDYV